MFRRPHAKPFLLLHAATAASVALAAAMLSGCAGSDVQEAPEVANASSAYASLQVLRKDLASGQGRLFAVSETLREATAPQDLALGPWFATYREQREGVRELAMQLRDGFDKLQEARQLYINKWEGDLVAISDPQLRQQSIDRRASLRDRFGALQNDLDNTKQAFQPLLQQLSDLQVYLTNDLTATGVQQVSGRLENAGAQAEALGGKLSADLAQLDGLINELAPRKG